MVAPPGERPYQWAVRGESVIEAPLRVLVIAADPLVRAGLSGALAAAGLQIEPGHPDVVLWDLGLDVVSALEKLRAETGPHRPTLALVPRESEAILAITAGASGALTRDSAGETIAAALEAVARGLAVFNRGFLASLLERPEPIEPPREALTGREREVLALLVEGLSNKAIAARLAISEHTAKFHVNAILGKLGVQKRVEAVVRAARLGMIDL